MNTDFLNGLNIDALNRGTLVSMMKADGAVFETFEDGGRINTIAFVRGLPMPMFVFGYLLGLRMAPNSMANWNMNRLGADIEQGLERLWDAVDLPQPIRDMRAIQGEFANSPTQICLDRMVLLFNEHTEDIPGFADAVRRLDEDYEMSLVEPLRYDGN